MKKVWVLLAVIAFAAGWFSFHSRLVSPTKTNSSAPGSKNGSSAAITTNAAPILPEEISRAATQEAKALPATSSAPLTPPPTETVSVPPLTVLDNARVAIHNYQDRFGENPVGDNSEITAALMGKNPKQVNFITAESGLRVNDKGELIDAWGTPFFFHQMSGKLMEIHSAGEDKKMWTFDDQVTR